MLLHSEPGAVRFTASFAEGLRVQALGFGSKDEGLLFMSTRRWGNVSGSYYLKLRSLT